MLARLTLSTGFLLALATCGSSDNNTQIDAKVTATPDATTGVQTIACPATPDAMVMINGTGTGYTPMMTTITAGQIVQFVTQSSHDATPSAGEDPGVHVGFSQTECKKFTVAGTFAFHCSIHGFMGSVVVN